MIKEIRERNNITFKELVKVSKLCTTTLYNIENGGKVHHQSIYKAKMALSKILKEKLEKFEKKTYLYEELY